MIMKNIYSSVSHVNETLVFLFLGIALAAFNHPYQKMGLWFFLIVCVIIMFSRALNIFAIFKFSNKHRK